MAKLGFTEAAQGQAEALLAGLNIAFTQEASNVVTATPRPLPGRHIT